MAARQLYIAYDPAYTHPLPEDHRFPMLKYELIAGQLLYEGTIASHQLFSPSPCPAETILLTHTAPYLDKLMNQELSPREQRQIGFPQSPALTHRERIITQGTLDCCHHALKNGLAFNIAGGTHHAFADRGEGFCLLNDFAVAANALLQAGVVNSILIVDLDVHQGNGTAKIFEQENRVFTFSMHGRHNYPFHKEQSDWDIPLDDGIEDLHYLTLLKEALPLAFEKARPDIVFYLSGVDILDTDKFGKLKISPAGCRERDEIVFSTARQAALPVVVAMGGGYSADIRVIVNAHCQTFRSGMNIYELS